MSGQADRYIAELEKWAGYVEKKSNAQLESKTDNAGSGNWTIFGRDYGMNAVAWCHIYLCQCARYAGIPLTIIPQFSSCSVAIAWWKKQGQWIDRSVTPSRGAFIYFSDSAGKPAHVGLVTDYMAEKRIGGLVTISTIEGNTSSASGVVANGGAVAKKSYDKSYTRILGYGRPKYIEEDETVTYEDFKKLMIQYESERSAFGINPKLEPELFDAATKAGITDGSRPGSFATRQETAVMVYRAFLKKARQ